jgi:hypothetical protein
MLPRRRTARLFFFTLATMASCTAAQSPGNSAIPAKPAQQSYPAPTNLKVLPREMTGQRLHELMEQWGAELGVRCSACHGEDQDNVVPAGARTSRFADDSQPMKGIARLMYTMTEQINRDYIDKVEGSGLPVTCGTCHRGRVSPEAVFAAPTAGFTTSALQNP